MVEVTLSRTISDTVKAEHCYVEIKAPESYEKLLDAAKKILEK
jgi:hypothetical protein